MIGVLSQSQSAQLRILVTVVSPERGFLPTVHLCVEEKMRSIILRDD